MAHEHTLSGGTRVITSAQHTFGTDAMLLSHFCGVKKNQSVCDLGTGCGIIPLRWHDMGHRGYTAAVDIAPEAVGLLDAALKAQNITHVRAFSADLREVTKASLGEEKGFETVCCNPPYFTGGKQSDDPARAQARHQLTCTSDEMCRAAARLLRFGGKLCVCQRPENLAGLFWAMKQYKIEPKELRFVFKDAASPAPWLCLVSGRLEGKEGLRLLPALYMQENGEESTEVRAIYAAAGTREG